LVGCQKPNQVETYSKKMELGCPTAASGDVSFKYSLAIEKKHWNPNSSRMKIDMKLQYVPIELC